MRFKINTITRDYVVRILPVVTLSLDTASIVHGARHNGHTIYAYTSIAWAQHIWNISNDTFRIMCVFINKLLLFQMDASVELRT